MAALLSGMFFSLAFWSVRNPFIALLTAFILLTVFACMNILGKLIQSFTTTEGLTGMVLCIALLLVMLKGVQGAHRIDLIRQEIEFNA